MPIRRILPGNPTLQSMMDSASRTFQSIADEPRYLLGEPAPVTVRDNDYICRFNQLTMVDLSPGSFGIGLPSCQASDRGKCVTIMSVSNSTNTLTIFPFRGTINGASSYALNYGYFRRTFVCVGANTWVDDSKANLDSTGPQPWFEWNETDLTQFDTAVVQTGISMSAAVITDAAGLNWIDMTVGYNSASVPPGSGLIALLPISATPPSADYMITADVIVPVVVGTGHSFPIVAVRGNYAVGTKTFYQLHWRTQGTVEIFIGQAGGSSFVWQGQVFSSALNILGNNEGITMRLGAEGTTLLRASPTVLGRSWMYRDLGTPIGAVGKAAFGINQTIQAVASVTRHYLWRNIRCYEMRSQNFLVANC